MNNNILFFLCVCSSMFTKAQVFQSAFKAAELYHVNAFVDSQGNIIITGNEPYLSPAGDTNAYHIIKYSPQGVELWRQKISSPLNLYINPTILNDKIYIVGSFQKRLHFANTFSTATGDYDLLYVKIEQNGNITVKTEGGSGRELFSGLCTLNNHLYAVGSASGQVQLNNSNHTFSAQASFMEKMDGNFTPVWIKWGFSPNNDPSLGAIKQSNNNLYAIGAANTIWDQGPTIGTYNYNLIKFDDSGNYLSEYPDVFGAMYHGTAFIAEGPNNEFYYMNCYWGHKSTGYSSDINAKNANKTSKWVIPAGTTTCSDHSVLFKDNKLYWYNGYINTSEIQNGSTISRIAVQQSVDIIEGYISEYVGDQILFYGTFIGSVSFGNTSLVSGGKNNVFVTILNSNVILSTSEHLNSDLTIYPIPTNNILHIKTEGLSDNAVLKILSLSGAELMQVKAKGLTELNIESLTSGMYFLKVEDCSGFYIEKIIKN